jgi:hypothetical protein
MSFRCCSSVWTRSGGRRRQHLRHLYLHLLENGLIVSIQQVDDDNLHVLPKEVLRMIQSGNPAWERLVPQPGVKLIKERGVFGYQQGPRSEVQGPNSLPNSNGL